MLQASSASRPTMVLNVSDLSMPSADATIPHLSAFAEPSALDSHVCAHHALPNDISRILHPLTKGIQASSTLL